MTTITIKHAKNITKTEFENIDELLVHFMKERGFGELIPLDTKELTEEQNARFEKALRTPKNEMYNI